MYIYHSQLSKGTTYIHAVAGNFSGLRKDAEIIVSRNRVLELYALNDQDQLSIHCSEYFHFTIRSLAVLNWKHRGMFLNLVSLSADYRSSILCEFLLFC